MIGSTLVSAIALGAEHLDVKGFHVGMQRWEIKAHESDFCYTGRCTLSHKPLFTVGDVRGRLLGATYDDSARATSIDFAFDSFGFDRLKAALLTKYPDARCTTSEAITRLGLHVPQVVCRYETETDGIYLVRVAGNINRSLLFLMSAEKRREVLTHIAAANHDL